VAKKVRPICVYVKNCIIRDVSSTSLNKKFSKRAMAYMLAYNAIELKDFGSPDLLPHLISRDNI
jgi:hypothetical protein